MSKIKDKLRDIATLQTAKENFFKNDGTLQQWFAHGATEAANMLLHGHPAPVYAGNASPPNLIVSNSMEQEAGEAPQVETAAAPSPEQQVSILDQKMQAIQQQPELEEPELDMHQ